jgi:hypothetical protein
VSRYTQEPPDALRWRCDCGTVNTGPISQKCDTCLSHHPSHREANTPLADTDEAEPMPSASFKQCARSGKSFAPTGNNQKFCGICPDCKAKAPAAAKPKAEKPDAKRKRVNTGFVGEIPRNRTGKYAALLDELHAERDALDARRLQLDAAITAIETLDAAEAA